MIEELNTAIRDYQAKWEALLAERSNKEFFASLKPTAVTWKMVDMQDFDQRFAQLRNLADQVRMRWLNERWLLTLHLKEQVLEQGITVVKLYQRRPGSKDAAGLDHIDFYAPKIEEAMLANETNLRWTRETSADYCNWISLWFAGTEAKLRTETVLDVCAADLKHLSKIITSTLEHRTSSGDR